MHNIPYLVADHPHRRVDKPAGKVDQGWVGIAIYILQVPYPLLFSPSYKVPMSPCEWRDTDESTTTAVSRTLQHVWLRTGESLPTGERAGASWAQDMGSTCVPAGWGAHMLAD